MSEICSDITELRECLDKLDDSKIEYAMGRIHDWAIDNAEDGKIDLEAFLEAYKQTMDNYSDDFAEDYKWQCQEIEDHFTQIESELEEYQEKLDQEDHLEFLDEIAANVTELNKYGTTAQKVQYLEKLDNDPRMNSEAFSYRCNATINIFGVIG